VLGLLIAIP